MSEKMPVLTVRPYQLLCSICSLGEEGGGSPRGRIAEILQAIRDTPDRPMAITCNAGDVFVYQDPGPTEDTSEGVDFNRKRDLDILQLMNWPPGLVLSARIAFLAILKTVTSTSGLCGYGCATSGAWTGCAKADSGFYEKGRARGITAIIPARREDEMFRDKADSVKALYAARVVTIRPHLLLCSVCQYARRTLPPYPPDNLPEFLQMVLTDKPDIPVRLVRQADWMMCAPCPFRVASLNACVNIMGAGGMSNEKRDLDVLQQIGLKFGDVMPARALYLRIFEKIPTTCAVCERPGNPAPSVWWDGDCGECDPARRHKDYEKGRQELMERFR